MGADDRTFSVNFSSEGVLRLRQAVEEKLKEFMGDYTDDTLVEYVIVLLKNGRSKDEAKNELDVFLGDDSDSFISWLWDHLGSNLSLYMQPLELQPDGSPKTKHATGGQGGKIESYPIEPDAEKGNSIKTYEYSHNQEYKGLLKNVDENEVPLPQNSLAGKVKSRVEPRPGESQAKRTRSLQSTIHKKRRRHEEQKPIQKELPQSTISAPRRLLQFAVRDAVATSRPSNAIAEPSLKRLRSVVSTTVDSPLEEPPQRIRRASMSVAIKAMAEAVKDVTKVRSSHNVFDRLSHATNVPNSTNHLKYGDVDEDVGDRDISVKTKNIHSSYYPENDSSLLQEGKMPSFHDAPMDSDVGYNGEDYDAIDIRAQEATDNSLSGTSTGNWVGNSLKFQYSADDNVDQTMHRPRNDFGQPATSLRIASSVSMNTRKLQYQEDVEVREMDNHKIKLGGDTVFTKSEKWFLKENNNPTVASNENAKPDSIHHQSEKIQILAGLRNAGPPTEDADSRTIFVGNVHFAATKDSLSRHFNRFGEVLKVIILTDPATGQPKGSAYIEFMRKEAAELALTLDGTSFMSRILRIVKKSSAQPEAPSIMMWPRIARASPFSVPRYGRLLFARGAPTLYRPRVPIKPGARSFQWKRGADSAVRSSSAIPSPTARSLTYVRTDLKANGSSGTG